MAAALLLAGLPAPVRAEAALGAWAAALGRADICAGTLRLELLADAAAQEAAKAHPGLLAWLDGRRASHEARTIRLLVGAYVSALGAGCAERPRPANARIAPPAPRLAEAAQPVARSRTSR